MSKSQVASGLSHIAIRARDILESIRYYTGTLGLPEAFRMHADDGSLATVYFFLAPGQSLELFANGRTDRVRVIAGNPDRLIFQRRPGFLFVFLPAFDLFISA